MGREFNESQKKVLASSGNVLVSASAGSGKTTVMIEKIFLLMKSGASINRMAVMTFSKASATDMKNRLVKKLYDAIRNGGEEAKIALKQLEAFPFSNICTIDSFCYGLLKKYYAVIGADPSATPLDPDESDRLWGESVDKAVEEYIEKGDLRTINFFERYASGRRLDRVKKLIDQLKLFLAAQPDKEIFFTEDFSEKRKDYVVNEFKKRLRIIKDEGMPVLVAAEDEGLPDYVESVEETMDYIDSAIEADGENFFDKGKYFSLTATRKPSKKIVLVADDYKFWFGEVKSLFAKIADFGEKSEKSKDGDDEKLLFELTKAAEKIYAKRKKRDGKLDFNDLSRAALDILDDSEAAKQIKESFDYIFVDEYQDTNYLQETLLNGISNGNNVFVVGDVKQAIYHFRYAEPEIFNERMNRYDNLSEGESISLNKNYRSKESILEFVNAVCGEVMTENYCSVDYRKNLMTAGTDYKEESRGAEVYFYDKEDEKTDLPDGVYSVREASVAENDDREGRFVAEYIKRLVGKEKIYRPKEKEYKTVSYGDIAVLTRKSKSGMRIAEALAKAGVPYTINETEEGDYYPRELLVSFLRLCVGEEDVPVIACMSCPIFGFTSTELIEIAVRDKKVSFWDSVNTYNGSETIKSKTQKFVGYINELRNKAMFSTVTELFIKVLGDGLDGYFDKLDENAGGRIRKFLSSVSALDCNNDVSDFLRYYDESYKGEKAPSATDSVTIMTMHKSKGLEFPVVFLPYCDEGAMSEATERFLADKDLGVALVAIDEETGVSYDTFSTKVLKFKKENDSKAELARLMYVDFTRAENLLVVSGEREKYKTVYNVNTIAGFIVNAAKKNPVVSTYFKQMPEDTQVEKEEEKTEEASLDFSYLGEKYRYEKATKIPNKMTVSEILEEEDGVKKVYKFTGEAGSAAVGTAYHLVMQKIDYAKNDENYVDEFISELVKTGDIEKETAEKLDRKKIAELLRSDVINTARKNRYYREQPFMSVAESEGGYSLIQGVIDLLIEENDGFTVVDFKASGLSGEKLKEKYARQLELYADAVEKIYKKKVKRKILLNVIKSYEIEI